MRGGTRGVVKHVEQVAPKDVAAGRATQIQVLIAAADGAPNFAMRRFVMGAGGGIPLHTNEVEHVQYVLGGRARVTIGSELHEVRSGSVLFMPAGAPHAYEVLEAPFEFLCMVPNVADNIRIAE